MSEIPNRATLLRMSKVELTQVLEKMGQHRTWRSKVDMVDAIEAGRYEAAVLVTKIEGEACSSR